MQQLRQSDVLNICSGQLNLRLHIAASDYWAAVLQDGLAGLVLCSAWFVAGVRAMPVSTEVGVGLHLEYLAAFKFQRDSLRPRGLEVLEKVYYRVPVRRPWILG